MDRPYWRRSTVIAAVLVVLALVGGVLFYTLRTTASVPSAPQSVHAVAGDGSAKLRWSPPHSDGGASIISYTATSQPGAKSCTTTATSCTVKDLTNGTSYTFSVVAKNAAGEGPASLSSNSVTPAAALLACWSLDTSPIVALAPAVRAVVTQYYVAKHLEPVTFYRNQEWVLDVSQQSKGVHYCANADGSKSGYVGSVPANALAAVMVEATHKPYPVVGSPTHFVTVAKLTSGWKVVNEGTGP
ncbi:MAG: fibronectin type III domain-containing protein [Acidimicrobiales bacterium]